MYHLKKKPFLIAEIGINHNGSLKNAFKLVDLAKKYGFDAVKFQKRNPEISTPEYQKKVFRETPWGYISYLDYKKKIELSISNYRSIDKYCKKKKIYWFFSAWDIESQKNMRRFNCRFNKVSSAMLTNTSLLKEIAKEKKKTFISTGMAKLKDIDKAVKIFKIKKCPHVLLHCVSTYPCPEEKLNLRVIQTLKKKYKCEVGYSGHESSVSPSILAWFLGAEYIERHITLDRTMWGTDQSSSLEENGLKTLSSTLEKLPKTLGDGLKKLDIEEKNLLKKFKYW